MLTNDRTPLSWPLIEPLPSSTKQTFTCVVHTGGGEGGEVPVGGGSADGGDNIRAPQSVQSVPREHMLYEAPEPPSSHPPSLANEHVLEQPEAEVVATVCAFA